MSPSESLARKAIRDFGLPEEAEEALLEVYEAVDRSYRDRFVELTSAMREQAATLRRIQETLHVLVMAIKPELANSAPVAFRIAGPDEKPDVASLNLEIADPISQGYTLRQRDLAEALGLDEPAVSRLVRIFKIKEDPSCAIEFRAGKRAPVFNFHPHAVERLRDLIVNGRTPPGLKDTDKRALLRARRKLT